MKNRYEIRAWVCDYGIWDKRRKKFVTKPLDTMSQAEAALKNFLIKKSFKRNEYWFKQLPRYLRKIYLLESKNNFLRKDKRFNQKIFMKIRFAKSMSDFLMG